MDSGSTSMLVALIGSILALLGLQAADTALPLLRRGQVRDSLPERGFRASALARLRARRQAYEELIHLLTLSAVASISALAFGLMVTSFNVRWPVIVGALVGLWVIVLTLVPIVEELIRSLSAKRLALFGVCLQMVLWPLLPIRVFLRTGLKLAPQTAEPAEPVPSNGGPEPVRVEEEIAEEPLEPHERVMIRAILDLGETPVREIMVPRVDAVTVSADTTVQQAAGRMLESGHSRLPVYEGNPDDIAGILYSRDLLSASLQAGGVEAASIRDLLRPCFFVPESKRIDELLREFQERHVQVAIVVDEYGGFAGIVTIEDLVEEIVGEIEDEFDVGEPVVEVLENGDSVVDPRIPVDTFNAQFSTDINAEGFDTLGGFLYSQLGKIPAVGDAVAVDGLQVEVVSTVGRRLKKVRVRRPPTAESAAAEPIQSA